MIPTVWRDYMRANRRAHASYLADPFEASRWQAIHEVHWWV